MNKEGIQLSFGMIFSIIIIISIVLVSFYVIDKFLGVQKCSEQALFYEDFQDRIDRAWNSEIVKDSFEGRVASGIDKVCLGDLNVISSIPEYEKLKNYRVTGGNLFMYPPKKACEGLTSKKIEHIDFDFEGIKCFEVNNGKVEIPIEKDSTDALVRVSGRF